MTDPLAHLYAETGVDDLDEELPTRETSLAELEAVDGEEELLSDQDVAELALLLRSKITETGVPDSEMIELGLADYAVTDLEEPGDFEVYLKLTAAGRRVVAFMLEQDFPEIGVDRG